MSDILRQKRKELKYTQEKVANLACISRCHYANIETGRKVPSLPIAKRIADVLRTTIDQIF